MYTHVNQVDELSISELQQLLEKREQKLKVLRQRRESASKMLESIDAFLRRVEFGVKNAGSKISAPVQVSAHKDEETEKKTPGKKQSLVTVLTGLLSVNSPQTVGQLTEAAIQAGYKSKAKSFRLILNQTLVNNKAFRKVKRATYALAEKRANKVAVKRVAKARAKRGHKK